MGPAQAAQYQKQRPVAKNGFGPQSANGAPGFPAPDTGPYFREIDPKMWAGSYAWRLQNPTAAGLGYSQSGNDPNGQGGLGAERELVRYPRLHGRTTDQNGIPQVGMGGDYQGLGLQPREALPTAATAKVARQGYQVVGGNTYAFLPPPDKFLVLNLRKVHPIPGYGKRGTLTRAYLGPWGTPSGGTQAPGGNG